MGRRAFVLGFSGQCVCHFMVAFYAGCFGRVKCMCTVIRECIRAPNPFTRLGARDVCAPPAPRGGPAAALRPSFE